MQRFRSNINIVLNIITFFPNITRKFECLLKTNKTTLLFFLAARLANLSKKKKKTSRPCRNISEALKHKYMELNNINDNNGTTRLGHDKKHNNQNAFTT